jgi:hypothetical protein
MPLRISRRTVYSVGETVGIYRRKYTDGIFPSVYTDKFGDGIISVGINYRRKDSVGNSVAFLWFSGSEIT